VKVNDNYFIGITLPQELEDTIERQREWMRRKWGCRSGMRTQPHITLIPPFQSDLSLREIKELLTPLTVSPFDISVSGFGSFGERTIFAHVEKSRELEDLQKKVSGLLSDGGVRVKDEKRFTPHITIANRDIKPEAFIPSMEYFNTIDLRYSFTADSVMIFEFRDYVWRSDSGSVRFSF
jgi:2'-5' RNA ligase